MTRKEAERLTRQNDTLRELGFTREECDALRRISMTLQRWHERECGTDNGCIERDEETGKPYWVSEWGGQWSTGKRCRTAIPDREKGAHKRLAAILRKCNERRFIDDAASVHQPNMDDLTAYIQGDPLGAALYIIRPDDVPEGCDVNAYYSRGICVY
jgi:hypothetical protein